MLCLQVTWTDSQSHGGGAVYQGKKGGDICQSAEGEWL